MGQFLSNLILSVKLLIFQMIFFLQTMPRVWLCFYGIWNEIENNYEGGTSKGLDVEVGTTHLEFVSQVYRISGINPLQFDIDIRCVLQLKIRAPTFHITNDEDLPTFLTWEHISVVPLYVTTMPKVLSTESCRQFPVPPTSFPNNETQDMPPTLFPYSESQYMPSNVVPSVASLSNVA